MKIKVTLIGALIILGLSFISAAMDPSLGYCEHMGYETPNFENCSFGDGNSCPLWDFYKGDCGQEYVKEIPCRKQGEYVFPEFEECCEGLKPYLPTKMLGQTTCQPVSKIIISEIKYNPLVWLGIVIVIIVVIYIIYKRRKK